MTARVYPAMRLSLRRDIDAPASVVWALLAAFPDGQLHHPWVRRCQVFLRPGQPLGARRLCAFHAGVRWSDQIIAWQEGEAIVAQCLQCSLPLRSAQLCIEVVPAAGARCWLRMSLVYCPRFGPLGEMFDRLGMRWLLRRALRVWQRQLASLAEGEVSLGLKAGVTGTTARRSKPDSAIPGATATARSGLRSAA